MHKPRHRAMHMSMHVSTYTAAHMPRMCHGIACGVWHGGHPDMYTAISLRPTHADVHMSVKMSNLRTPVCAHVYAGVSEHAYTPVHIQLIYATCLCHLSMPPVFATFLCHLSMPPVYTICLYHLSIPPVYATCPYHLFMPPVYATCLCHLSMLRVHVAFPYTHPCIRSILPSVYACSCL